MPKKSRAGLVQCCRSLGWLSLFLAPGWNEVTNRWPHLDLSTRFTYPWWKRSLCLCSRRTPVFAIYYKILKTKQSTSFINWILCDMLVSFCFIFFYGSFFSWPLLYFVRTYASKYIPIIASVSEHQPPTWPSYFMDINVLAFLVPAGIIVSWLCSSKFIFLVDIQSIILS